MFSTLRTAARRAAPVAARAFSAGRRQVTAAPRWTQAATAAAGVTVSSLAAYQYYFNEAQCADDAAPTLVERVSSVEVQLAKKTNMAFVFIKPHADTAASGTKVHDLVRAKLAASGIKVTSEGNIGYKDIDEKMLIDTHYGAIANRAVKQDPKDLVVQEKAQADFAKAFGVTWADALASGQVYNATQACAKFGTDGAGLEKKWSKLSKGKDLIKFGGGFYAGLVDGVYVINGFYMSMRGSYTTAPASIHYYTVEWPAADLSWSDFRGKVLGATDPNEAEAGSARRSILEQWESLGLPGKPNTGDNGVHASASPFEALAERVNWLGQDLERDVYGRGLLGAGVTAATLGAWSQDPAVVYGGKAQSIFDLLEDLDADACLEKAADISATQKAAAL